MVSTIDATEIEIWSQRAQPAASSRKKQLEILRADIKRGVRDNLVEVEVTDDLVVSLRHVERPHWSSAEFRVVIDSASSDFDATMFRVLGVMGLRENEMRTLRVGDLVGSQLTVRDSKTRAGVRTLPVAARVLSSLLSLAAARPHASPFFELRHTFAAIALSEAGGNLLSVSRALGHARPSITLDRYGHLAPAGLEPLMALVDAFASPEAA